MGKYFKHAMFITSFIPLWITVIFIDVLNIIKNSTHLYTEIISLISIGIAIVFSSTIILISMKTIKNSEPKPYKIVSVSQEKGVTSEFLLSYILPLFTFNFTVWDSVLEFLVYFLTLQFLCVRNNNVYANLLFEFKGYKFYTCELKWAPEPHTEPIKAIVISRLNLCANKGNTIEVTELNKPFYLN